MESAWRSATGRSLGFRRHSSSTASSPPRSAACSCPDAPRVRREPAAASPPPRAPPRSAVDRFQSTEEDLNLLLRLKIAGPRRHFESLPVGSEGFVTSSRPLQRPAKPAVGRRVVGLEPYRLLVLDDGALSLPSVEVGAGQAEPDNRVIRHQVGHFLELGDPVAL